MNEEYSAVILAAESQIIGESGCTMQGRVCSERRATETDEGRKTDAGRVRARPIHT